MSSYYFFGELGYLHQVILAFLERYANTHPDKRNCIELCTFEGYDLCIEKVVPSFFSFRTHPLMDYSRVAFCSDVDKEYASSQHISKLFDEPIPGWLTRINYFGDMKPYYISSPITSTNTDLQERMKGYERSVVFFFRHRITDPSRNFQPDAELVSHITSYFQNKTTLCLIYAVTNESELPSFVDSTASNVYLLKTLDESISAFQQCDLFLTNHSGLEDLAKNCNTKEILILPDTNKEVFVCTTLYQPFQTKVRLYGTDVKLYHYKDNERLYIEYEKLLAETI
jgi:hypothetical protein